MMAKSVVVRLRDERATVMQDYALRSGLGLPALVDRALVSFIEHNPPWLTELMRDRDNQPVGVEHDR